MIRKKIRKLIRLFEIISPDYTIGVAGIILLTVLFVLDGMFSPPKVSLVISDNTVPSSFASLSLKSQAVYVYDVMSDRELFSINKDAQLPLASLTKIMMAVTATKLLPENSTITINSEFIESEGDSGLFGNEKWNLKDLIDLTLLKSANDGANAIASVAGAISSGVPDSFGIEKFVSEMNDGAKALGLNQTYFLNPTGLDESEFVSGGYGSAHDVSKLFAYAIKTYPQLFDSTRYESREYSSLSDLKHTVKNTNTSVAKIPSLLGSKTGYTDLAGGNLVIAFDAGFNYPIVITVLGSTEQGRFEDVEKLVWSTLEYLSHNI